MKLSSFDHINGVMDWKAGLHLDFLAVSYQSLVGTGFHLGGLLIIDGISIFFNSDSDNENGVDSEPDSNNINSVPVRSDRNHSLSPLSQVLSLSLSLSYSLSLSIHI